MDTLFLGIVILLAAIGMGRKILNTLHCDWADNTEALVFSTALGFGLLAYLVFGLGSLGLLKSWVFVWVIGVIFALTCRDWSSVFPGVFVLPSSNLRKMIGFFCVLAAIFSLMGALAPATGQDELCYHLMQPANYVRAGRIYEVPFSTNSLWPYLMEMLFTLGILLNGAELAKFFHFAMYLVAGGAIYCFVKRFGRPKDAFWGLVIYSLTPATFIQSAFAYVDNALAAYLFLCAYALCLYSQSKKEHWVILAGALAGFAISTKLIGVFILPIAVVFFLRNFKMSAILKFGAAFLVCGSAWYLRAAILRGNPIFPFYPQFFGGHGWNDQTYVDAHGRGMGWLSFLTLPWDTTLYPDWFGGEHIGPLYLMLLPLLIFQRPWQRSTKYALGFAMGYAVLWFKVDPNIRFFFPALAFLSAALAPAPEQLMGENKSGWKIFYSLIFVAIFGFLSSLAVYHFRQEARLFFSGSKDAYLMVRERSYNVAKIINQKLTRNDRILSTGEARGYYFQTPFVLEGDFNDFTHYGERFASAREVVDFLKQNHFTHVLSSTLELDAQKKPQGLRAQNLIQDAGIKADYFKEELVISVGSVRYVLYKIKY